MAYMQGPRELAPDLRDALRACFDPAELVGLSFAVMAFNKQKIPVARAIDAVVDERGPVPLVFDESGHFRFGEPW